MANWFCSVFNVVCVVNVCPVHADASGTDLLYNPDRVLGNDYLLVHRVNQKLCPKKKHQKILKVDTDMAVDKNSYFYSYKYLKKHILVVIYL